MKAFLHTIIVIVVINFSNEIYSQTTSKQLHSKIIDNSRLSPDIAIENAKKLLSLAKENNSYDTIAMAFMYMAKAGRVKGDYKQSLSYVDLGIDFAKQNDVSKAVLAELYLVKANNLADSGLLSESAKIMFEGVEIANQSDDDRAIAILNHGLGYIYYASKDYEKSIKTLKRNISFIEEKKLFDRKSFETYYKGMIIVSNIYLVIKQRDSALLYLKRGLKNVLTTDDVFTTSGFYKRIGDVHLENKNFDLAYENLLQSRELGKKIGNNLTESETDYSIAYYHFLKSDYNESINELNTIVRNYEDELRINLVPPNVYKLLADNYKKLGNLEKANENYELYVLNYQNDLANDTELSDVIHDKELSDVVREKENQQKISTYLLISGVAIILFLVTYLLRMSNKREKDKVQFETLISKVNNTKDEVESRLIIDTKDKVLEEVSFLDVNDETVQEILNGLKKLETQEYFLKQECNSYTIAKKIKTNTSYLSKVVNSHYQKNFNTYINDLRINYAILRLKNDRQFRSYSIQSIANEIGYKSADSFTKYFKKDTGLNPSIYIKKLNSLVK